MNTDASTELGRLQALFFSQQEAYRLALSAAAPQSVLSRLYKNLKDYQHHITLLQNDIPIEEEACNAA